jgi:signal transduction histidine kinase
MFESMNTENAEYSGRKNREHELLKIQKLEAVGVLAGGIAHDFNNLLQTILGNISLVRIYGGTDSRAIEFLENVEKAVNEAKELSYRLLTFSQGGEPHKEATRMRTFVKVAFSQTLSSSNIATHFDLPDDLSPVYADRMLLNQVFYNLAINAKESMPNGGVLTVKAKNVDLSEKDNLPLSEGRYIQIAVSDQGAGIPEENITNIFDPYFTTKEMGTTKGQGLGLTICHSIIKKHDGLITVESGPGTGSTFHIYLPAWEEGETEQ